ncbi:unnamed protein product [Rotaria sp. Silwood2]|nr:unnamed protein product [Rotaria sp. Silwood2]CAF2974980.1 unnamed protein product [Rotaria sp. Silwood2]CAF3979055.1 unnamed protein product [Rotaria sp. Silwood2]CAF4442869.1 unnamed protein product [Rotaria sp. Silwood2]
MLIMQVTIFLALHHAVHTQYSLYYSDIRPSSYLTFDCLYTQLTESQLNEYSTYIRINQLTPYCRRPDNNEKEEEISDTLNENVANKITFKELSEQGVTSEQLLKWSAPIDLAERYEMNNQSSDWFYNCSSPWFGLKCQYRFVYNSSLSFNEILDSFVESRFNTMLSVSVTTCYRFLADCNLAPWSLCLDWRQVCNGKVDCMNAEDEQWCETLEMTKCADDEYRCHYGGQCIPMIYVRDGTFSIDCLDGSEEVGGFDIYISVKNSFCGSHFAFRCDERIDRYPLSFPCGNGEFLPTAIIPVNINGCSNKRNKEVALTMFTSFDHIKDSKCQQAFRCSLLSNRSYNYNPQSHWDPSFEYFEVTWDTNCELLANSCLDKWLTLPEYPVMYGYFQFVYLTNRSINQFKTSIVPDFVCFDAEKCPALLSRIVPIKIIDGLTCCRTFDLIFEYPIDQFHMLNTMFFDLYHACSTTGNEMSCANSSYFHCNQSLKCISYHRVGDGFIDCYYNEDESFSTCHLNDSNRLMCTSDPTKCLLPVAIGDGLRNCPNGEDESDKYIYDIQRPIPFSSICDTSLGIKEADGNETDETNCEWWPCDTAYSHCNVVWDCYNGIDELNCSDTDCSLNEFQCKNDNLNLTYCLPLIHMFHKLRNDCTNYNALIRELYFYNGTSDISKSFYSFNKSKCITKDNICNRHSETPNVQEDVCLKNRILPINVEFSSKIYKIDNDNTYLCSLQPDTDMFFPLNDRFLTPLRLGYYPSITSTISDQSSFEKSKRKKDIHQMDAALAWYCHYGVLILFKGVNQTKTCLCPPNYFGSQCQWQSQRVSLTLQFRTQTIIAPPVIFQLIIMLIDEQGNIAPNHEQITYMPAYDCNTKFNIYLLYPYRPKYSSTDYSIRIDLFDKSTLDYWASWYLPIPFQFLPVNRISNQLVIPEVRENEQCTLSCGQHGRCMKYTNMNNSVYCRCDQGYFGTFCNITHQCQCSKDSFCLAPSICVCPLNKFGSRCYLKRSICQSTNNPCQHNGFCIAIDDRINLYGFICVCKEGYQGERCQYKSNQIDIHIDETILTISSSFILHYIIAYDRLTKHEQIYTLKKIAFGQNTMTIYVRQPFNILFIQIPDGNYYLTILRERFVPSEYIHTTVSLKNRCYPVLDLFNDTFRQYEYLRQVKYYPLLCRQDSQLMCFYDKYYMCICDSYRFSNCFDFNSTIKYDCSGKNVCYNDGRCFLNNPTCPTTYICACDDCYYGVQCQFSTKDFIFSLDPILGYHIKPNISLHQQPFIVKFSIIITTIMLISEMIMGSLCIATFRWKKSREVGCGYYLLASSISSICMIIVLTIKFWQLVLLQMLFVTNRSILSINCISIEIILKSCLTSCEWLNACVAIERMFSIMKGITFNKQKSKVIAKRVIFVIIIVIILTHMHDPFHRQVINDLDGDQQRIWCLSQYPSTVTQYNTFITLFHFLVPFSINLISALIIIIVAARSRFKVDSKQPLFQHIQAKLKQYKHIIIAPTILFLLGLPRLIISFAVGCMRSPRQSWLYLIGYFVSFIPSMLTLFVFVLPSKTYRNELNKTIQQWIRRIRRRS